MYYTELYRINNYCRVLLHYKLIFGILYQSLCPIDTWKDVHGYESNGFNDNLGGLTRFRNIIDHKKFTNLGITIRDYLTKPKVYINFIGTPF